MLLEVKPISIPSLPILELWIEDRVLPELHYQIVNFTPLALFLPARQNAKIEHVRVASR